MSPIARPEHVYADGHPFDSVHYLECKILLKPKHFTEAHHFKEFEKLLRHAAAELDVALVTDHVHGQPNHVREVVFYDTPTFELYDRHFILRRRVVYENGFAKGDPELALKFRHGDVDAAAAVDVRPRGEHEYVTKFKEELLPLPNKIGGVRSLFSHNIVLKLPLHDADHAVHHASTVFPSVHGLALSSRQLALVNDVAVEEVLHDLGELHFGHGVPAKANVAVWRRRADEQPLVGEFAFQCKFLRDDELHGKARKRAEKFFVALQHALHDWIQLGTTKTRIVYDMGGTAARNRE